MEKGAGMKRVLGFSLIALLAACGVDGEPIPPGEDEPEVVTSTNVVLTAGTNGAGAGIATTMQKGKVSITLGTGLGRRF